MTKLYVDTEDAVIRDADNSGEPWVMALSRKMFPIDISRMNFICRCVNEFNRIKKNCEMFRDMDSAKARYRALLEANALPTREGFPIDFEDWLFDEYKEPKTEVKK